MNILYIDRLSIFSLCYILTRRITCSHIYYLDINRGTKLVVALLERIGIIKKIPTEVKFCLGDLRDEYGSSLYIKIYNDIAAISKKIRENELVKNGLVQEFGKYFDLNKFMIFFEYPIGEELRETVVLFHAALWHKRENFEENTNFVIFFKKGLFSNYLLEYAELLNIKAEYYPAFVTIPLWKYFQTFKGIVRNKLTGKFAGIRRQRNNLLNRNVSTGDAAPRISVLYTGKSITFNLKKRSDFFWFLMSNIPRENIFIYFETIEVPRPAEAIEKMRKEGIGFINMMNKSTATEDMPTWVPTETSKNIRNYLLKIMFKAYFKNLIKMNFIQSFYIVNIWYFILKYAYWYDFFRSNNIKVNINQNIFSKDSCPKLLSLEKSGGINISYQYTNINSFFDYSYRIFSDVLFLFGPDYKGIVEDCDSIINNIVYYGYITDYSFSRVKEDAQGLRKRLVSNGARFIICFFDENSSNDRMSTLPENELIYIYEYLLNMILSDETLGLICSPKNIVYFRKIISLLRKSSETDAMLQKAERTGRLVTMNGTRQTHNYPTEVAQAADLCIGFLLGGTAILEAYLSNTPSIFLDLERLYMLDIYKWGKGKVVFDDINEMLNAITKYREDPDCIKGFGNLDLWAKKKDPFRDGNASLRIGQYINWLHGKMLDGDSKRNAIEYANRKFAETWGRENVLNENYTFL